MAWANGDVRINLARDGPFSRIPDRRDPSAGVARADYPPKAHRQMSGPPQPPREEYKPNTGYYPKTAPATYGIIHPDYSKISSTKFCDSAIPNYKVERQDHVVPQMSSEYPPPLQRGYSSSAFTAPHADDGCSQVCSECPGGGAPCEYGPQEPGYPIVEIHSSCLPPEPPETFAMEMGPSTSNLGQCSAVSTDSRSVQSHQSHASHCDLRDFEEWRGLRGSRESLGSLPPDLQRHLQNCRCQCDHLGYGNYEVSEFIYLRLRTDFSDNIPQVTEGIINVHTYFYVVVG